MKFLLRPLLQIIFKALGWRVDGNVPSGINKAVLVFAPHTSNWDGFYGLGVVIIRKLNISFFIKNELNFFPLNWFLKQLGAFFIKRGKIKANKKTLVDEIVDIFNNKEEFFFLIQPEGTRSYNPNWKMGFYHIAKRANVPMILTYLDYSKKVGSFGEVFYPTDNMDKDIEYIKNFYQTKKGKYPEKGVL